MSRTRKVLIGLMATSTLAVPLATVSTSDAAARPRPVVKVEPIGEAWIGRAAAAFSPNGDHVKDKGRVAYRLGKKSEVTVKVRRTNKAETVIYKEKLGKLTRGDHTWVWKGKDLDGAVVSDGSYQVVLVADQVAEDGKTGRGSGYVHVDTKFDAPWSPEANTDTVYPKTLVIDDRIGLTLNNDIDDPTTALGAFETTLKDAQGSVLSQGRSAAYHSSMYPDELPFSFTGRFPKTEPLPAGAYKLRYKVWDLAGNPGGSKSVTVNVSDKVLVEARGTVVVPPAGPATTTAGTTPASVRDGRSSKDVGQNDPPRIPCGTVVASQVYSEPGAKSYRSSDACGDTWSRPAIATLGGGVNLATTLTPEVAPRGVQTATFSMRGRPTVAGETDTARFSPARGYYPGGTSVVSAAVAVETVTSTQRLRYEWEPVYSGDYTYALGWAISTIGNDSFDVADVTVSYTYLTPQPS